MPVTDSMPTLSASAFAALKNNVRNSKALKLIQDDAKKDSHIIAERNKDRQAIINQTNVNDEFSSFGNNSFQNSAPINEEVGDAGIAYDKALEKRMTELKNKMSGSFIPKTMQQNILSNKQQMVEERANKIPKEIVEAFKLNPINQGLDDPYSAYLNENNNADDGQPQQITEQTVSSVIDYDRIQKMIESTVKKYAVALNKKMINESRNNGTTSGELKAMKIGDKFSFITSNGDVYEAKLTYRTNINKKK